MKKIYDSYLKGIVVTALTLSVLTVLSIYLIDLYHHLFGSNRVIHTHAVTVISAEILAISLGIAALTIGAVSGFIIVFIRKKIKNYKS